MNWIPPVQLLVVHVCYKKYKGKKGKVKMNYNKYGFLATITFGILSLVISVILKFFPELFISLVNFFKNPINFFIILSLSFFLIAFLIKKKIPPIIASNVIDTLTYLETNKKDLINKYKESEYVKSFLHLNISYYAVTVFIIRQAGNGRSEPELLFTRDNAEGNRYVPLGTRLPKNQIPENFIKGMISEALGIEEKSYCYFTISDKKDDYQDYSGEINDETKLLKQPIAIQLESNPQRDGVPYHVDFIYLIQLNKGESGSPRKKLKMNLYPEWKTISEIRGMITNDSFRFDSTKKLARLIIDKKESDKGLHLQP